jgi:DNA polymerase-3 subunit delta
MRLRLDQLENALTSKLQPVYLVGGDEPLLVQEAVDLIRAACKKADYSERTILHVERQFDWAQLNDEANALSLFAEKKLIELRLGKSKPGIPGAKSIMQYLAQPSEDNILLIECGKLDASATKSKWLKSVEQAGCFVQVWPVGIEEMPRWLSNRAKKMQLNLTNEALSLLSERLEGNLLAAVQELEKLKLNYPDSKITDDKVLASVEDSSRYDIFNLTDASVAGNSQQAARILSHLRTEGLEPTIALWALSKEVRILDALKHAQNNGSGPQSVFSKQYVIKKRQPALVAASNRLGQAQLREMLSLCADCDQQIKGMQKGFSPWDTLLDIALLLSGASGYRSSQAS